ncbi:ART5 isoform 6 [Pongo abelii]|uniref:ART5 isoform 6 n=1 Tax=Pongo abelii TaxID=9601 RepID=A0A2J8V279_PONAB|nr:ART5 isoform 6 [Pongo abelii]
MPGDRVQICLEPLETRTPAPLVPPSPGPLALMSPPGMALAALMIALGSLGLHTWQGRRGGAVCLRQGCSQSHNLRGPPLCPPGRPCSWTLESSSSQGLGPESPTSAT